MLNTQFTSEVEYLKFKDQLRNVIIKIIAGMVLGILVTIFLIGSKDPVNLIFMAIVFAGVPYAWSVMPVFFTGIIGIILNIVIAVTLGWVITPIALVYNIIQMKRYESKAKTFIENAQNENDEQKSA